jgi:hypothetical protein
MTMVTYTAIGFVSLLVILIILCIIMIILLLKNIRLHSRSLPKENHYNYKYTAVIVEDTPHKALSFILQNLKENLSEEWGIVFFHSNKNKSVAKTLQSDRVTLVHMPLDHLGSKYEEFINSSFFMEHIPTDTYLIASCKGMILPRYKHMINDFLNQSIGDSTSFSIRHKQKGKKVKRNTATFCLQSEWTNESFSCFAPWDHFPKEELFTTFPEMKELYDLQ